VDLIQQAVVSYYGQFETPMEGEVAPEGVSEAATETPAEEAASVDVDEPPAEEPEKQSVTIETSEPSVTGGV
jgi:hypothetical protein